MSRKIADTEEMAVSGSDKSEKELGTALKIGLSTPFVKVVLRLIPAILIVVSLGMFVTGVMKYDELQGRKEELEKKVDAYEYEIEELRYLIDSPIDYDYIVRVAREKLNLHLPDEIVYYNDTNE